MMNQTLNDGKGKGFIVVQDFGPISEGSGGSNHYRAIFIPVGDHLRGKLCPLLVNSLIA